MDSPGQRAHDCSTAQQGCKNFITSWNPTDGSNPNLIEVFEVQNLVLVVRSQHHTVVRIMGSGFCNQRLLGSLISRQQKPFFGSHAKQNSFSSTLLYKKHDRAVLGPGGVCCKAGSEDQPRPTQLKLTDLLKPDWPDKVTNWQEVMMADEDSWLDLGEDIDEIDDDLDEHDFEALSGGRSQRAGWAVDVISKRIPDLMKTNEDFVSFMPVGPKPRYTADIPTPIEHLKPVKMPMDDWELRAMVEKRRQAKAVDEDWQRRRAEVGKFKYLSISHTTDVRQAIFLTWPSTTENVCVAIVGANGFTKQK